MLNNLSMKKNEKNQPNTAKGEVVSRSGNEVWYYSDIVKNHFFHPQNFLLEDPQKGEFDAQGLVGSPACGDMMKMWLKVDRKTERIKALKWRTFGCASAIASTSMFSVMVTEKGGMKIDDALKIRPQDIIKKLGGLPARKYHCSVLADKAFRKTINNYFRNTGQHDRIMVEGSKVVDERLNITEKDIEEAVLEGACDLESAQKKLKVGVGFSKEALQEIEELIRFYKEKYFG